eukprot:scaffold2645_cov378-Prasinococcus_capsulatus_cf.AAC.18
MCSLPSTTCMDHPRVEFRLLEQGDSGGCLPTCSKPPYLELLAADSIGHWPGVVILLEDLRQQGASVSNGRRPHLAQAGCSCVSPPFPNARSHLALLDDAAELLDHWRGDVHLLADHCVVLVVGVVGVSKLAIRAQFELEVLVTELPLVAHVVA